ncbi:MAG: vitamin K epoxide reductase family protein [Candidatus Heimdallarchaeota archaeon]|nr:vitamin K epoxide reductase family protein [Candidatus Heimdallarchaeota archaeon]
MTDTNPNIVLLQVSVVVALIGFLDALYLYYMELTQNFKCLINTGVFQCETVNQSVYAKILGIPVSLLGCLFYLAFIAFLFLAIYTDNQYWLGFFLPAASIVGFLFSIYLTVIEIFVIKLFCEFCVLSAICSVVLIVLIFVAKSKNFPSLFAKLDFWNMFKKET